MADPRGLSGAVFQPTQIRDFTNDLLVSGQYKAKKEAASQKQDADYLSQFDVGKINNAQHQKAYSDNVLDPIKSKMIEVAELKQTNPKLAKEAQMELNTMTRDAKIAVAALNALDASAAEAYKTYESAKDYAGEEGKANIDAYNQFVDNPTTWDFGYKNGELQLNGQYFLEGMRPQKFSFNEPYDLRSDITEYYSVKRRDGIIDRGDIFKELNRARGSKRQEKQFYNYLKEQKGYDEDRIQSAIQADSEGLVEEFYEFAAGELMSEKDENTKTESGDSKKEKEEREFGVLFKDVNGNTNVSLGDKGIKFSTNVKDASDKVFKARAKLIGYRVEDGKIMGEFTYGGSKGIELAEIRELTPEDIASINSAMPKGQTLTSLYNEKVGGNREEVTETNVSLTFPKWKAENPNGTFADYNKLIENSK